MVALELDSNDGHKTTTVNQPKKGQKGIGSREPNQERNPNELFDLAISNCNNQ
jgi:organic hydroperoxide reductase OsmC/OhrA